MRSTPMSPSIMTMISNFTIIFIFQIFSFKYNRFLHFHMFPVALLLIISFFLKLIIPIARSRKNLQNFFIQSLPLYTPCSFFMLLNDDIAEIKNLTEYVCLLFLYMNFQDYFYIHQSFLLYVQDLHK